MFKNPLRIAINAQFEPQANWGGVESVLFGLAKALGELDGAEEYVFIASRMLPDALLPYLGNKQTVVTAPDSTYRLRKLLQPLRPLLLPMWEAVHARRAGPWPQVPLSSGFYENLGCEVIHFPYQEFVLCSMPSIYNPHDLQHRHFPAYFSPREIARREATYSSACHLANTVAVGSEFVKDDIASHFRIDHQKIQVIPWAPPTEAYEEPRQEFLKDVRAKYGLEDPFAFYPSVFWPHKNHLRLFESLAVLRERDRVDLNLICTGGLLDGGQKAQIGSALRELRLEQRVKFLGRISSGDLRAVYRMAQFVIVPTLFEAASGPVFEAWREDVPAACSAVTSLPQQVRNAALLFDPLSIDAIADALKQMTCDSELRKSLRALGRERLSDFSWKRTAKAYRAVYRRAAGRPLNEEDRWLLEVDWMKHPAREPLTK